MAGDFGGQRIISNV